MKFNAGIHVPDGWQFLPLKRITRFGYGDALSSDEREKGGVMVYGSNGPFDEHSASNTLGPCIIIGRKGSYGKLNYSNGPVFAVDTTFVVDRSHTHADLRFLYYLLSTLGLDELSDDTAVPGLSRAKAYQSLSPLPPLDTQRRITRFLDEKTARIDSLIEKKRELLDRLAEKRQALITQAVTKGLDPDVPLKPSGIDWLGDIPVHWDIRGLTKCTNRIDYRGATPQKSSSGIFLVTAKNIKKGQIDYDASREFVPAETYEHVMRRGKPKLGEVLFTTEAPLGEVARVDNAEIALAQRIIKFSTALPCLTNDYLSYWMYSSAFHSDVVSRATGSTALGLKASKIVELRCLLPPKHEQVGISEFLDRDAAARRDTVVEIQTSVERLSEYRAALITAAITGRIGELV